jgi:tripartite-type tricarboxylate transporter receptor subunit TctC
MNRFTHLGRRLFHRAALATALGSTLCLLAQPVSAQTWPDKPIRLVVPAPPGSGLDQVSRILAERLSPALGQPVMVDNKPGGAGIIGAADVLKSPRDGSTFMVMINGFASEIPHIVKMPFEPLTSFRPVVELARYGLVFTINPQVPANDLASFITYAKANKGKVNFASYTAGTVSHTLGLELNKAAGLDMVHVPYKGSPPALQDLMGGQVQAMFDASSNVQPYSKAGRLKVLATTAPQRLATFPDVPTFAELGYKDLTVTAWAALWSAADVPPAIQQKMREATLKVLQDPKVRETFVTAMGWGLGSGATPEEMVVTLRGESDRQGAMLKAIGFKPE